MKLTSSAVSQAIEVTKPDSITLTAGDITVDITFTRVDGEDAEYSAHGLLPVEYGKVGAAGFKAADYTTSPYDDIDAAWHYAIKSLDGNTLYWDTDANTYAGYNPTDKDNYAIYKCNWTANYDAAKKEAFAVQHASGMSSTVAFTVKSDAHASTGFWTSTSNPGSFNAAPGSGTSLTLAIAPSDLDGATSASGSFGYVMVYCHGADVTATVTVGVTATPGTFN